MVYVWFSVWMLFVVRFVHTYPIYNIILMLCSKRTGILISKQQQLIDRNVTEYCKMHNYVMLRRFVLIFQNNEVVK